MSHLCGEVDDGGVCEVLWHEPSGGGDIGGHICGTLLLGQNEERLEEGEGGARLRCNVQEWHRVLAEHIVGHCAIGHHPLLDPAGQQEVLVRNMAARCMHA